jgi:hypothetical protein
MPDDQTLQLPATTMTQPHHIRRHSVYTLPALQVALGLAKSTLSREIRLSRLKVSKRAGKYFVLGQWVLRWLADGAVQRHSAAVTKPEVQG